MTGQLVIEGVIAPQAFEVHRVDDPDIRATVQIDIGIGRISEHMSA